MKTTLSLIFHNPLKLAAFHLACLALFTATIYLLFDFYLTRAILTQLVIFPLLALAQGITAMLGNQAWYFPPLLAIVLFSTVILMTSGTAVLINAPVYALISFIAYAITRFLRRRVSPQE